MDFYQLIADLGFPIASATICGYFIFLTMKLILAGVMSSVKGLTKIIVSLDNRVRIMDNEVIKIDTLICIALDVKPDIGRIGRIDGQMDSRKD